MLKLPLKAYLQEGGQCRDRLGKALAVNSLAHGEVSVPDPLLRLGILIYEATLGQCLAIAYVVDDARSKRGRPCDQLFMIFQRELFESEPLRCMHQCCPLSRTRSLWIDPGKDECVPNILRPGWRGLIRSLGRPEKC